MNVVKVNLKLLILEKLTQVFSVTMRVVSLLTFQLQPNFLKKIRLRKFFEKKLPSVNLLEFDVQQLEQGSKFVMRLPSGQPHIITVSRKIPNYFDLWFGNNENINYFSNTGYPRKLHSGDIVTPDNILIHLIKYPKGFQVTGVNGYSNNPLIRYAANRPLTLVIDHCNKIIYIVPVPLDRATVGDNTTCVVLGTQVLNSHHNGDIDLFVEVLESPPTCLGSITDIKSLTA